jgi:hypothetical protein
MWYVRSSAGTHSATTILDALTSTRYGGTYPLTLALVLAPGHTLDDLAHADTAMAQPYDATSTRPPFKLPGYTWGIDY